MIVFNLFPWRRKLAVKKLRHAKKVCLYILSLAVIICVVIHSQLTARIESLQAVVMKLESSPSSLSAPHTIDSSHLDAVFYLKQDRQIFYQIGVPYRARICLNEITKQGNEYSFLGCAYSLADLHSFLNEWPIFQRVLTDIKIKNIKQTKDAWHFHLLAKLKANYSE